MYIFITQKHVYGLFRSIGFESLIPSSAEFGIRWTWASYFSSCWKVPHGKVWFLLGSYFQGWSLLLITWSFALSVLTIICLSSSHKGVPRTINFAWMHLYMKSKVYIPHQEILPEYQIVSFLSMASLYFFFPGITLFFDVSRVIRCFRRWNVIVIIACICRASFCRSICGLLCSSWCSDGYEAMLAPLLPCNKVHRWEVASDSEPYWWTQAGIRLIKIMANCVVFTSLKFNRFCSYMGRLFCWQMAWTVGHIGLVGRLQPLYLIYPLTGYSKEQQKSLKVCLF